MGQIPRSTERILVIINSRFKEGLMALGVLEAIQVYPNAFRPAFCMREKITAEDVDKLFIPHCSDVGSNRRSVEAVRLAWWKDYLIDAAG